MSRCLVSRNPAKTTEEWLLPTTKQFCLVEAVMTWIQILLNVIPTIEAFHFFNLIPLKRVLVILNSKVKFLQKKFPFQEK